MNRLTAIGLASLVAYGVLIASKYTGIVSAARQDAPPASASSEESREVGAVVAVREAPRAYPIVAPAPVRSTASARLSAAALEFRAARDLRAYAEALAARRASLTSDERFHLARALEECQFVASMTEDLAAFSAKKRQEFLATLPLDNQANNARRIAAYDAADNTQRCLGFQTSRISPKEIQDLYAAAAQQGDARAQARLLVAELTNKASANKPDGTPQTNRVSGEDVSRIIGLLETKDPEAVMTVGQFLAQSALAAQLRVGPSGEVPEASAFLGAFSLVACDMGPDCMQLTREPLNACAYAGYCNAQTYEELYQNFLASPYAYSQAMRYRDLIHTAIDTHNWTLIGLVPGTPIKKRLSAATQFQQGFFN